MGKTRLHEAALDRARARKLRVLRAAGSELEQNLAFGVAAQLLRSLMSELPGTERITLLEQAPSRVRTLEGIDEEDDEPDPGDDLAVSHGLFSLFASAAESRPAIVAIDDLHWVDTASLEFVLYLLHRLDELPVALVMSARPSGPEDPAGALAQISAHPRVELESLVALGQDAVGELVEGALGPRATKPLVEVCARDHRGQSVLPP